MGLKLAYTLPNTLSGDHWSISEYWVNSKILQSYVIINLYKDSAIKDLGKPPLPVYKRFDWNGEDFPFTEESIKVAGASIKTLAYTKIKATPMPLDEEGNPIGDLDWSQSVDED